MKNLQTGEIECSVPREKLYGNVLESYDSMEKAQVVVEKHEEQKRMQELYEQQLEHERQLALEELLRTLGGCCLDRRRLITTRSTPTYVIKCNLKYKQNLK